MNRALLIVIIVFVTVCMAEVTCRIYDHFYPCFIFSYDAYWHNKTTVGLDKKLFHLNSKGFKDTEHPQRKEQGIYRIIGIGDSFVYGVVPHDNNFLTIVERKLNRTGRHYEVVNMGVPATGIDSFYRVLVREALPEDPDMVILCFFIGNDFTAQIEPKDHSPGSYLYSLLRYIFLVYPNLSKQSKDIDYNGYVYHDNDPTFELKKFLDIESQRSFMYQFKNRDFQNRFNERFNYASFYFKAIKDQCEKHHVRLLVVIIPDELQVNPDLQKQVARENNLSDLNGFDFKLPDRLLKMKLENLKIDNVDLLDEFLLHSSNRSFYKPQDTHWNLAGNAFGGELVLRKVKALLSNIKE